MSLTMLSRYTAHASASSSGRPERRTFEGVSAGRAQHRYSQLPLSRGCGYSAALAAQGSSGAGLSEEQELLICTNKTCKKQGSQQIAKYVEDLHLPGLRVKTTGCLGACGAGPNIMLLPDKLEMRHVSTVSKMTDILREVCGFAIDDRLVQATQLRIAGNLEARSGNLAEAEKLYTEALALQVEGTVHLILANRSGVRLSRGDLTGALADADAAAQVAPPGFTTAYVRQVEARAALKDYRGARDALEAGAQRDPEFANCAACKSLRQQLGKVAVHA